MKGEGKIMSIALAVKDWDRSYDCAWVVITDTDYKNYRYEKRNPAPAGALLDVDFYVHHTDEKGNPVLTLGLMYKDRKPVLQQDEPGLPLKIVAQYRDSFSFIGAFEYEQVSSQG